MSGMVENQGGAGTSYGFPGGAGAGAGGLSLDKAYSQARRALLIVRDGLERLERLESFGQQPSSSGGSSRGIGGGEDAAGPAAPDLVEHLKKEIGQLQVSSAEMDSMWRNQMLAKGQRDLWKRRVEQVAEEVDSLKAGLDRYLLNQHRRQVEAQERAELFRRTRGDGAHILQVKCIKILSLIFLKYVKVTIPLHFWCYSIKFGLQVHDDEMQALQSAKNSSRMLEDAYATGVAVLGQYAVQRDRLKSAQRKAYDVLNSVGMGNRLMRVIERRQKVDRWIAYGGMLVTVIILIVVIKWLRWTEFVFQGFSWDVLIILLQQI
jgi:Golgi SNAP receptor complex protein 2